MGKGVAEGIQARHIGVCPRFFPFFPLDGTPEMETPANVNLQGFRSISRRVGVLNLQPELGRQTFTEMVRLKGYMVYDAEQLADKCGMEYGSFRRKVKKMTGYTAKEWVIKERAKDVEHYLKNTNLTLTEVAFTTGFASTSNLNDFCKAYLLDTPGEIRRKAQETRKCTVTRT